MLSLWGYVQGFFTVYRRLFEQLFDDESRVEVIDPPPPSFGAQSYHVPDAS
jgi:hypothetical protein